MPKQKKKRICNVKGCGRKVHARSLCPAHYQRQRVYGDLRANERVRPIHRGDRVCRVSGCQRKVYAKKLCRQHYWRWKTHGDVRADFPIRGYVELAGTGLCRVAGCKQEAQAKQLCTTHYYRYQKYGDVFENIPIDQKTKGLPLPEKARRLALPAGQRFCPGCKQDKDVKQFSRSATYCKRCARAQQLKHKYALTLADYDRMLAAQQGRCALCGTDKPSKNCKKAFAVDHDHKTGRIRGLLCLHCNRDLVGGMERRGIAADHLWSYLKGADILKR